MVNDSGDDATIVVGVDGSQSSKAALRWAGRQARLTHSVIHAIAVWEYPRFGPDTKSEAFAQAVGVMLADAVVETLGADPGVEVRESVEVGHPAQVLLATSAGQQMLVVGSRGLGGFAGVLLGSVSQHCVQHATCPVVIIRGET